MLGLVSNLRHKQHTVSSKCANEDGSCHGAVDQIGPGVQEEEHGNGHGRGESDQSDSHYDGGRLVDWRMADVAGESSQVSAIEEKATLDKTVQKT